MSDTITLRLRLEQTHRGTPGTSSYVPVYIATIEISDDVPGVSNESEEDAINKAVENLRHLGTAPLRLHSEHWVEEMGVEFQDPRGDRIIEIERAGRG